MAKKRASHGTGKAKSAARERSNANLVLWKKGQSGNPGGRTHGGDLAAEIARAVFAKDPAGLMVAMEKAIKKGNVKGFGILAERGYGKLTQKLEIPGIEGLAEAISKARKRVA